MDALGKQHEMQLSEASAEVNFICFFSSSKKKFFLVVSFFSLIKPWLTSPRQQKAKQREDNKALHESMQAAASNATAELQTKDKRIRHLERKVVFHLSTPAKPRANAYFRYNHCGMNVPPRPANSP